ncbi:peptidoglycan-recognition protein SC2-like isoform X1 [Formica exsecta]|uniref:peptidoglycan-recognition protein SC2-like isoform X1 n=1 Tax=Formica exsecta TaxID=72781 RepID=UPI001141A6DE|nr:peptidoglycan-recognition protein SC2-like isoform X1 [Formica exsecta]
MSIASMFAKLISVFYKRQNQQRAPSEAKPAALSARLQSGEPARQSAEISSKKTNTVCDDLNVISRAQWGARAPKSPATDLKIIPAPYVLIHHSATSGCETQEKCELKVRSIQNYHMDNKRWDDIGYNFIVGEDGNVYEGRGWGKKGAHSIPYNNRSIGVCILGDYSNRTPNATAIEAVAKLIARGVDNDEVKSDYKLLGHRQTWATACPGNDLYAMIQSWPHWTEAAT